MNIVIISSIAYTFPLYQRIHHFVEFFLKNGHKVLFIEPLPFTKNQRSKKNLEVWCPQTQNVFSLMREKRYYLERTYRGMYRFFQLVKFFGGFKLYRFLRNTYERRVHRITRGLSSDAKMKAKLGEYSRTDEKIAFFQFPHYTEYIPKMKELGYKIIYDMVDDISEFEEVPKEIKEKEVFLLRNADFVIATSKPLFQTARRYNGNVKLIQNGVEYKHFIKARKKCKRPSDMPSGKPIVGYYGAIWTWFDECLLLRLAKERPNYNFVLIGTIHEELRRNFSTQSNIHYLGEKSYKVLPDYLHYFGVAIVPFKDNNLTRSVNPVKVYEYLAGGKSVVYSGLQNTESFPCVYHGDTPREFLKHIDSCLKHKCNLKNVDSFLKNNDWSHRYEEFAGMLINYL